MTTSTNTSAIFIQANNSSSVVVASATRPHIGRGTTSLDPRFGAYHLHTSTSGSNGLPVVCRSPATPSATEESLLEALRTGSRSPPALASNPTDDDSAVITLGQGQSMAPLDCVWLQPGSTRKETVQANDKQTAPRWTAPKCKQERHTECFEVDYHLLHVNKDVSSTRYSKNDATTAHRMPHLITGFGPKQVTVVTSFHDGVAQCFPKTEELPYTQPPLPSLIRPNLMTQGSSKVQCQMFTEPGDLDMLSPYRVLLPDEEQRYMNPGYGLSSNPYPRCSESSSKCICGDIVRITHNEQTAGGHNDSTRPHSHSNVLVCTISSQLPKKNTNDSSAAPCCSAGCIGPNVLYIPDPTDAATDKFHTAMPCHEPNCCAGDRGSVAELRSRMKPNGHGLHMANTVSTSARSRDNGRHHGINDDLIPEKGSLTVTSIIHRGTALAVDSPAPRDYTEVSHCGTVSRFANTAMKSCNALSNLFPEWPDEFRSYVVPPPNKAILRLSDNYAPPSLTTNDALFRPRRRITGHNNESLHSFRPKCTPRGRQIDRSVTRDPDGTSVVRNCPFHPGVCCCISSSLSPSELYDLHRSTHSTCSSHSVMCCKQQSSATCDHVQYGRNADSEYQSSSYPISYLPFCGDPSPTQMAAFNSGEFPIQSLVDPSAASRDDAASLGSNHWPTQTQELQQHRSPLSSLAHAVIARLRSRGVIARNDDPQGFASGSPSQTNHYGTNRSSSHRRKSLPARHSKTTIRQLSSERDVLRSTACSRSESSSFSSYLSSSPDVNGCYSF